MGSETFQIASNLYATGYSPGGVEDAQRTVSSCYSESSKLRHLKTRSSTFHRIIQFVVDHRIPLVCDVRTKERECIMRFTLSAKKLNYDNYKLKKLTLVQ